MQMWTETKSLTLSKAFVALFMLLIIACAVLAPRIVNMLMHLSLSAHKAGKTLFFITIYTGCAAAAALLMYLYILLHKIGEGCVFIPENTACLRNISWCCFIGAAICLASGLYYIPWYAIGVAASFMGLIVRIVKNVFAKAVSLQDEAELTI